MTSNALYNDLSSYYDLMCSDIDYALQSNSIRRLHQLFGAKGKDHLDLGCGTGPHIQHFINFGYHSYGLDINQPMLNLAKQRCPKARYTLQNMRNFKIDQPFDLISCFLYSIHYNENIDALKECIHSVHQALKSQGVFCFNAVDKNKIDNNSFQKHSAQYENAHFEFCSGWNYCGSGEQQHLRLSIKKNSTHDTQIWHDQHAMVAVSFGELQELLKPYFEVHIFEHNYDKIESWNQTSGNAIFTCVKN